jgi:hypothetical protein
VNAVPKLNFTLEPVQNAAGLLPVSNGTAVVDVAQIVHQLHAAGLTTRVLADVADAAREEEYAYAMAILDPEDTGIEGHTFFFHPDPEGEHGARIKVNIDPAMATRPGGKQATVPFDPKKPAKGPIAESLEKQVRAFIELNREVLMRYWRLEYSSTKKFIADIRPLPSKR